MKCSRSYPTENILSKATIYLWKMQQEPIFALDLPIESLLINPWEKWRTGNPVGLAMKKVIVINPTLFDLSSTDIHL